MSAMKRGTPSSERIFETAPGFVSDGKIQRRRMGSGGEAAGAAGQARVKAVEGFGGGRP